MRSGTPRIRLEIGRSVVVFATDIGPVSHRATASTTRTGAPKCYSNRMTAQLKTAHRCGTVSAVGRPAG